MFSSKPHWSDEQVLNALREHWNVTRVTELKALPGERDQNVRVTRGEGEERLVFKVSHEEERLEAVEAQTRMLRALSGTRVAPRVVEPSVVRVGGNWVRVLTYVEGQPLACVQGGSVGEKELRGLGEMAARVDEALASLSGVAPPPEDFQWDLSIYDRVVSRWIDSTPQPLRGVVERVYEKAHAMVAPKASLFPRQVIHNDLNTWNVLITPEGHLAAIDFGDAMHTWRVAELAIAAAYAMLLDGMPCTPLAICQHIAQGYESRVSLNDAERACLFPLAALRLCTSAVVSATQMAANPENEHVAVYYEQVKRVLPKVLEVLQATPIVSFRSGTLADEPFWLASVREVLELEGTITWSEEESARQSALWRRYCADDTCTVALDAAAHIAGLVTWEFGSRTPYAPPCAANDVTPYVWIAVSYTAHAHRRQGGCQGALRRGGASGAQAICWRESHGTGHLRGKRAKYPLSRTHRVQELCNGFQKSSWY